MFATVESLIIRPKKVPVYYFLGGPLFREIITMAIARKEVEVILFKVKHGRSTQRYQYKVALALTRIIVGFGCEETRLYFEGSIVSPWPLAIPGPCPGKVQGCFGQGRNGLFIFSEDYKVRLFR